MEKIIEFIQNTWIVGIATGIISGVFVHFITVYALNRKKKSEYRKAVECANNAVFDIIQSHIVNLGLPDKKEMEAIINTISRRYGVKSSEMNSLLNFYEDFIVAFIGNLYIPNDVRKKNIEILLERIELLKNDNLGRSETEEVKTVKRKKIQMAGILAGTLSAMGSILAGLVMSSRGNANFGIAVAIISAVAVAFSAIIAIITVAESWLHWRTPKREKRYKRSENMSNKHLVSRSFLRMSNCGTDINDAFSGEFAFVNYFKEDE